MATPIWQWYLADTPTMDIIGPLDAARNKTLNLLLNQPGSAQFTINEADDYANYIEKRRTCLVCKRRGNTIWSGPIWTTNFQASSGQLQVGAGGWFKILAEDRIFQPASEAFPGYAQTFTDIDDAELIHELLDKANQQGVILPGAASSTFIVEGSREPGFVRTRKYEPWQNIGEAIMQLTQVENGKDIYIDPDTRELNVYNFYGTDNPQLVWGFNAGPDNLKDASLVEDASKQINRYNVLGKYGWGIAEDTANQDYYGLIERQASLPEVVDNEILVAYGEAEIAVYANHIVYEIFPKQYNPNPDNTVPEPFVDYNIGDIGYFSMKSRRYDVVEQAVRIFGIDLNIDDDGNESVQKLTTNLG